MPYLEQSLGCYEQKIEALLERLRERCFDEEIQRLAQLHGISQRRWAERLRELLRLSWGL